MQLTALASGAKQSPPALTKKLLLVMKLTAILLFGACLSVAAKSEGQTVTLSVKNAPLEKVFQEIKKQSGYSFVYAKDLLQKASAVTVQLQNASIDETLKQVFKDQPFTYSIISTVVTINTKLAQVSGPVPPVELAQVSRPVTLDVTGKVTDASGLPLAGASVKVKGTTNGTTTNADGEFLLKGVEENATLMVSYAEHVDVSINVGNRTSIMITLQRNEGSLKEVIINKGYYTEKQRNTVGNVTHIDYKVIEQQPVQNVLLALQGRVPGLVITQTNGLPGGGVKIRIQGQNSITFGNDPLIVIDGVPYFSQLPSTSADGVLGSSGGMVGFNSSGNPLNYINPNDIESVDVLKDADATAIYGSRAANGAILITTKKGKAGQMKFDVNLQSGWGEVVQTWDMMDTRQYLDMRYEALRNDGINLNTQSNTNANFYDLKVWDTTSQTDWQKKLLGGKAQYTNLTAGISGGTNTMQYLISGTYNKQTTVFPGDFNDQKGSLHFNISSSTSNQKLKMQISGSYMVDNNHLFGADITNSVIRLEPVAPSLYNSDGALNWAPDELGRSTWTNPLAETLRKYNNKTNSLVGNLLLTYKILPGLDIKSSMGYNSLQTNDFVGSPLIYRKPETRSTSQRVAIYGNRDMNSWIWEPQITYNKTINKGTLNLLIGGSIQQSNSKAGSVTGVGYNSDDILENMQAATQLSAGTQYNIQYKYNAVFSRMNYTWSNKYIAQFNGRRDGTSRFGAKSQFHNFFSIGGAWIVSEEAWMHKQKVLSFTKLRISYGTTGSDQIGDYSFLSLYNFIAPALSGFSYQNSVGIYAIGLSNPLLQWEETHKFQGGVDVGFVSDRILISATYSRNRSSNQLLNYALPTITGFSGIARNFPATVQNSSWEFSINTINIKGVSLTWKSSFNLTLPKNKLIAFPDIETSYYADSYIIGAPLDIVKTFHYAGVDPATGLYQFFDHNGNATSTLNSNTDRIALLSSLQKYYGGMQNSIQFKGFELDFFLQFVRQMGANYSFWNGVQFPGAFVAGRSNQPVTVLSRWQKPGDVTEIGRFTTGSNRYRSSDQSYIDASYISLKNLSLSYQLPVKWKKAVYLKNCRLYLNTQNILTFTKWKGLSPETMSVSSLPPLRVWTFGLQVSL